MRIALLGYGKMGKTIETIACERNHNIVFRINRENLHELTIENLKNCDIAIEFSTPQTAVNNIYKCFEAGIPVIIGTTGWLEHFKEIKEKCIETNQTMLFASNFSIGVNLFFELNRHLARIMNRHDEYDIILEEIHHIHKKDSPSGTGITLAEGLIENIDRKNKWVEGEVKSKSELQIISKRIDEVPGTHIIKYCSEIDDIEIKHQAHSRKGFAIGAVVAAEWLSGKKGVYGMNDVLGLH
jgi:4-hydroxy-tetrahydrodipicolinate reductase